MRRPVLLSITLAAFAACYAGSSAAPGHRLLVVNAGNEAIFALHVRPQAADQWGGDLLPFNQTIAVSRGEDVDVVLDAAGCRYDVEAVYGDGDTQVLSGIDLCSAVRVQFDH